MGSNASADMERYRNGYPGQEDDTEATQNFDFYSGKIPSRPQGDFIDAIHEKWWHDYDWLEAHHGYIQWLFPIREHGMNWDSQKLQKHEIESIKGSEQCIKRFLTTYDMQLNFYGVKVVNRETGELGRTDEWEERYRNLEHHGHNYLRITRILKCLGELGFEHYKKPFLEHFIDEIFVKKTLRSPGDSCRNYWVHTLRSDNERTELANRINELAPPRQPQFSRHYYVDSSDEDDERGGNKSLVLPKKGKYDKHEVPKKSAEEVEREKERYRRMIAAQNAAGSGSGEEKEGGEEEEVPEEVVDKYAKWINEDSSDDEEDEVAEGEREEGAGAVDEEPREDEKADDREDK